MRSTLAFCAVVTLAMAGCQYIAGTKDLVETPVAAPTDASADAPSETAADAPSETAADSADAPGETAADAPSDTAADAPSDAAPDAADAASDGGPSFDGSDARVSDASDAEAEAARCSTVCSSVCVDTATDPKNCGACGHSCLGGTCSDGSCQPTTIASAALPLSGLAVNSSTVFAFDVLGNNFSALDPLSAHWVPKGGGTLSTFNASTFVPGANSNAAPAYVGATDSLLIWQITRNGSNTIATDLFSCALPGCSARTPWLSGFEGIAALTCDPSASPATCYVQTEADLSVVSSVRSTSGGSPVAFSPPLNVAQAADSRGLAVYGGYLYGAGSALLQRVLANNTGTLSTLANMGAGATLTGPIYATAGSSPNRAFVMGKTALGTYGIYSVDLPNGKGNAPADLLPGFTSLDANHTFYADNGGVFWFDANQQLVTCPPSGCTTSPRVLANGSSDTLTSDGQALYWIVQTTPPSGITTSSIIRLAR